MLSSTLIVVGLLARPQNQSVNLDAWFLKDSKGQSCASCHSVDGIELRAFADADIDRRTNRHHQGEIASVVRQIIRSSSPAQPATALEIRPLQPGGIVLPGKTSETRDKSFLINLKAKHPKLFINVASLQDAQKLQNSYLALDIRNLPVGIEMNRLSEDGFHGRDHATIANWIPDVPAFDSSDLRPELEKYYGNPTTDNLEAIDKKVVALYKGIDEFSALSLAKYRSLLVYQHELRTGSPTTFMPKDNPFWQIAEFGRNNAEGDPSVVQVPKDVLEAKSMSTTFRPQMKQLRLPWYWLGWIQDPSLTKSGQSKETNRAEYFCRYLEEDGPYIGHTALMLSRKLAEHTRNPLYAGIPFEIQYSTFLANTPLIEREPKDPEAKKIFRQLVANSFRMTLYMLESDLMKNDRGIRKVPQVNQMKYMRQYFKDIKDPSAPLVDRVEKRLLAAKGT